PYELTSWNDLMKLKADSKNWVRGYCGEAVHWPTTEVDVQKAAVLSEKFDLFETTHKTIYKGMNPALDAAAKKDLDIVMAKYVTLKVYEWSLGKWRLVDALSFSSVCSTRSTEALKLFYCSNSSGTEDFIRRITSYTRPLTIRRPNLLVELAWNDLYIQDVKYLWGEMALLSDAGGAVEVLNMLLDMGRISLQPVDKAFETPVESEGLVLFLQPNIHTYEETTPVNVLHGNEQMYPMRLSVRRLVKHVRLDAPSATCRIR
ncbi:hypothetical protein GN958_ATG06926, partial [Phytophthora infestans]